MILTIKLYGISVQLDLIDSIKFFGNTLIGNNCAAII